MTLDQFVNEMIDKHNGDLKKISTEFKNAFTSRLKKIPGIDVSPPSRINTNINARLPGSPVNLLLNDNDDSGAYYVYFHYDNEYISLVAHRTKKIRKIYFQSVTSRKTSHFLFGLHDNPETLAHYSNKSDIKFDQVKGAGGHHSKLVKGDEFEKLDDISAEFKKFIERLTS